MNRIILLLISAILAPAGAFAAGSQPRNRFGVSVRTEGAEVRARGRAACAALLNPLTRSHLLAGVRDIVADDFGLGVMDDPNLSVPSYQVTLVDAVIVQLLSDALEEDVATVSRLYTNSAMILANALGSPGKLNYVIRLQSARGLIASAGLPAAQVQAADSRLRQIFQQE